MLFSPNQPADTCDFHEVQITPQDTGLVESWRLVQADLSELGGPSNGWTFDCVVQEVDIAVCASLREHLAMHLLSNHAFAEQQQFDLGVEVSRAYSYQRDVLWHQQ